MSSDPAVRAEYEARFRQEAKAAGGLNHPNLITIYDIGHEGDTAYMAMEVLEGVELRDMMKRGGLELPFVLEILAQVADGLAFAHERGVVHRDVKPGNIMIVGERRAKVMDFGVARMRASDIETQVGAVLGSPKYMSPEQVTGSPIDGRSDVFSLGVILYELTAGAPPFSAPDVQQYMLQIAGATPAPPSTLNPALPPMLDLIVARALEKDPARRYQSAADLAADLRACLGQPGMATAPAPAPALDFEFEDTVASAPAAGRLPLSRRFESADGFEHLAALAAAGRSADGAPLPSRRRLNEDPLLAMLAAGVALAAIAALVVALV
jgi:serine/threonine-protein kinase